MKNKCIISLNAVTHIYVSVKSLSQQRCKTYKNNITATEAFHNYYILPHYVSWTEILGTSILWTLQNYILPRIIYNKKLLYGILQKRNAIEI